MGCLVHGFEKWGTLLSTGSLGVSFNECLYLMFGGYVLVLPFETSGSSTGTACAINIAPLVSERYRSVNCEYGYSVARGCHT